ncbi:hypothetical protein [Streptomyces eurocidicus]|uniref:Transcriptional regulator n=2 Tax=Streptomyces eurocidicus TaxID=66423 RepID=A0A7W8BGW4_STREU|nr:hypothetical protein [Streptomyces eurocidicus]MBB5121229.1 hypothetical protein [Streptomyces eurocidicus]MBF6055838.1 hypothetical protein [Streptomyces eurocidicus]
MAQHPLAFLRTSAGMSHPAYARLIAETHAELGFGNMAARREKVSRWESGRTVPELGTQLAMAHVHRVSEKDVRRLGWPHWLHLATDDDALLEQPWTPQGAISATRRTAQPGREGTRSYLAVTGPVLEAQIKKALAALASPQQPPAQDGHFVNPDRLAGIEARTRALEVQGAGSSATPMTLHHAARAGHRLVGRLLATGGYDRPTGTRLLLLATRTAALCGYFNSCLGDEAGAERYDLTAIRSAAAAGSRRHAAACMSRLAILHLIAGDARDALSLVNAAQSLTPRPSPRFDAFLLAREALALARLGEARRSTQALDRATALVTGAPDEGPPTDGFGFGIGIDEGHLNFGYGYAWHYLGDQKKALAHFAPFLAPSTAQVPPRTARRLLYVVDAHLSLGDLDAAVDSAYRAVDLIGSLPPGLADQYRRRFVPYLAEAPVSDLLPHLADHPAS